MAYNIILSLNCPCELCGSHKKFFLKKYPFVLNKVIYFKLMGWNYLHDVSKM